MKSVNQQIQDATIAHGVDLSRYSQSVVLKIIAVLNRSDRNLHAELLKVLANTTPSTFQMERLEGMLGSVRAINSEAYAQVGRVLNEELRNFADYEMDYQLQTLIRIFPVQVSFASVAVDQVYVAAMSRPFQGALLKDFLKDQDVNKARLIRRAIASGFMEGRTTDQIVRSIIGTLKAKYADGLLEITRREAQAVVRTALSHLASNVQESIGKANLDVIKAVQWSSTLDSRTSEQCRIRDQLLYDPVTHKPQGHEIPWLAGPGKIHWNCRSAQVFVTKSLREMGIDLPELVTPGERASMDGQVAPDTSYATWIKQQSAARQDDILGPRRGALLRKGGLELKDLYSARGTPLTLVQLRERDAAAFKRAGL